MKKILIIALVAIMAISLTACGGEKTNDAYVGNWISVSGTAMGYTLTGEDIDGFALTLKDGGKGTMKIDGDEAGIKWTDDGANIIIKVQGEELVGAIGDNTLLFKDLLGTGMDLTFAKEGTDAAKPENFLPENEKKLLGSWTSYKVTDVLGDDVSGEVAADALKMTFNSDHTVDIEFRGEAISAQKWSMLDDWGSLDDSDYDFSWSVVGEEIEVTYNGDDYWIFTCAK